MCKLENFVMSNNDGTVDKAVKEERKPFFIVF